MVEWEQDSQQSIICYLFLVERIVTVPIRVLLCFPFKRNGLDDDQSHVYRRSSQ